MSFLLQNSRICLNFNNVTKVIRNVKNHGNNVRNFCAPAAAKAAEKYEKKGVVIGVYESAEGTPQLTKTANSINEKSGGKLIDFLNKMGPSILKEGHCALLTKLIDDFWQVAVVGLGKPNRGYSEQEFLEVDMEVARHGSALGTRFLTNDGCSHIAVESFEFPEQAAEGAALTVWRYQENLNKDKWKMIPTLELYGSAEKEAWQRGLFKAEAQNLARRLSDTAPNQLTPELFAQQIVNILCPCGVKVEVHDKEWIKQKKFEAILAVAKGSCNSPFFVELKYNNGGDDGRPIVLIGKGVTFDSGGLCLKRDCAAMSVCRGDMSGAAAVVATIRAAAALNLPVNVVGLIPLCEHMPSGMGMKPGDIITCYDGQSIKIHDTSNEGRLLMADTLAYAQKMHKASLLIDVSTMTNALVACIGSGASGVFTNRDKRWEEIKKAGAITGDRVVRLPLWDYYRKFVSNSKTVDMDNRGKQMGSTCIAAAFLSHFVSQDVDWIHIDSNGSGMMARNRMLPYYEENRMMGRPTRTLVQLLHQLCCEKESEKAAPA